MDEDEQRRFDVLEARVKSLEIALGAEIMCADMALTGHAELLVGALKQVIDDLPADRQSLMFSHCLNILRRQYLRQAGLKDAEDTA
jgi:hypothetical protein